jgi:hypothetical protein
VADDDLDGLPDYLTDDDLICLGGDPHELIRAGVEPCTGHDVVRCWARQDVIDRLGAG